MSLQLVSFGCRLVSIVSRVPHLRSDVLRGSPELSRVLPDVLDLGVAAAEQGGALAEQAELWYTQAGVVTAINGCSTICVLLFLGTGCSCQSLRPWESKGRTKNETCEVWGTHDDQIENLVLCSRCQDVDLSKERGFGLQDLERG